MKRALIFGFALMSLFAYLASGLVIVSPGEAAVVFRLGRLRNQPLSSGPHWGLPIGLDRVEKVRIDEVRSIEIGSTEAARPGDEPSAGEYLTGDRNLVRVKAVVQYRVDDPARYLVSAARIAPILARLAESSLARSLASRTIDATLLEGRAQVARDTERELRRSAERYGLGVAILGVSLIDARAPSEVQPDFAAAQAAGSDRSRRISEAKSRAIVTISRARAVANRRLDSASASADRVRRLALASADRFEGLLAEADRSRSLTIRRLYLDSIRDLLPRVRRKVLLTPEEPVDVSLFGDGKG